MKRTLEQKRAQSSLQFIKSMVADADATATKPKIDKKFRTKLNTLIQKAPIQVLQNGLGQMLTYLLADNGGKTGHKRESSGVLYDHLQQWLCGSPDETHPCRIYPGTDGLIEQLVAGDRNKYIRAQKETLALFIWLKKFATAWLDEGGQ